MVSHCWCQKGATAQPISATVHAVARLNMCGALQVLIATALCQISKCLLPRRFAIGMQWRKMREHRCAQ